jgi:hypothetical protein
VKRNLLENISLSSEGVGVLSIKSAINVKKSEFANAPRSTSGRITNQSGPNLAECIL